MNTEIATTSTSKLAGRPKRGDRWATAYHEAGHTVASYFLGVPFERVTIVSDGTYGGAVYQEPYEGNSVKRIRKEIIILLAGELAERASGLREWDNTFDRGEGFDLADIENALCRAYKTPERRRQFMGEVRQEATELITSPEWLRAIKALAATLYEVKELDYQQAVKAIRFAAYGE